MSNSARIREVRRFMRSEDGRGYLDGIANHLKGHSIRRVTFAAVEDGIATTLHLDNKGSFRFLDEELTLEALYERYGALLHQLRKRK